MAETVATPLSPSGTASGSGGWRGPRSIAGLLFAVMAVMALITATVSYVVSVGGVAEALETDERLRAARTATEVEQALAAELRLLRAAASALAAYPAVGRGLRDVSSRTGLADLTARERAHHGVDALELRDLRGRIAGFSGSLTDQQAEPQGRPPGTAFEVRGDGGWLSVTVPVEPNGEVAGHVSAGRSVGRSFLRDLMGASELNVSLLVGERLFASTLPEQDAAAQMSGIDLSLTRSESRFYELGGEADLFVRPIRLGDEPLRVAVHIPESLRLQVVDRLRLLSLVGAAVTLLLSFAAAAFLSRWLGRPLHELTGRARELSQRFAGGTIEPRAGEVATLVASFEAMTAALLSHSERLKQAHANELQHSFELQRQYAMMRLLRGVAAASAESANIETALRTVLHDLAAFFGWPVGRAALLEMGVAGPRRSRSLWVLHDEDRFASFVAASNDRLVTPAVRNLVGRAFLTGAPFWVSDIDRLPGWNRLAAARACQLRSAFAIPVMASGHAVAFIEFFCDYPVQASAETDELLATIADELSRLAERHLAQQALAASQALVQRLALVAERTEKLFLLLDRRGRIEWANASVLHRAGATLEALRGSSPYRVLSPAIDDARAVALIGDAIRHGVSCRTDYVAGEVEGRAVFEIEGQPLTDEHGGVAQYMLLCTDVTERRCAEMQARASEQFFRVLFDESPVPMSIQDERFVITRVNAAFVELLGRPAGQLVGTDPIAYFHPEDRGAALAARAGLGDGSSPRRLLFERRLLTASGRAILVTGTSNAFIDPEGRRQWVSVVFDVTDSRAKERALIDAKDAAEQANRAKSQFLANMSHEIRTPMNGVLGMTELLLGTPLTSKQRRFVEAVYRSGETLLEIINDMLDLSKIEAGKLELDRSEFCLRVLVEDVFEMLAPRAHEKRLELACRIDPAVPTVLIGDAMRLRQVFANLVGNAIKFTEQGEVVVTISAEAPAPGESRHRLCFEVRDTGIGIPADAMARLFSPFMQADQSMSRRFGGTGLGLTISRQLVEMMGGGIEVQSEPGQGSVFRFDILLPAGEPQAVSTPLPAAQLRGRHVLLVEDNVVNRGVLEGHMNAFGMLVASAVQGAEALELLRAAAAAGGQFDILVVDMKMPVMDGATLVEQLRKDPQLHDLPVVMLTSIDDAQEGTRAQAAGVQVQLAKPVRQSDLADALALALGKAPARVAMPPIDHRLRGRRLLLAEDNAVNQEVVRAMLADCGCELDIAADGEAAVAMMRRSAYDLVLMDCQMPRMDGFEALRQLRNAAPGEFATAAGVAVVALTANALAGDAERCLAAGFNDHMAKPVRRERLVQTLGNWVSGGRGAQQRERHAAAAPVAAATSAAAAAATADRALLDMAAIERIRDMQRRGATDLLARLRAMYFDSSARLVQSIEAALASADGEGLRQAAHTLKSSSGNLGAARLARACAELEALGRAGRIDDAAVLWRAARIDYEGTLAALAELDLETAAA
jgi:PAS domain S-box-containing protein